MLVVLPWVMFLILLVHVIVGAVHLDVVGAAVGCWLLFVVLPATAAICVDVTALAKTADIRVAVYVSSQAALSTLTKDFCHSCMI